MRAPLTVRPPCPCDSGGGGPVRDPFRVNRDTRPRVVSATRRFRTLPIAGSTATPIFFPNSLTSRERLRADRANWNHTKTAQEFDGSHAARNAVPAPTPDNAFTRFTRQFVDSFGARPGILTKPQRGQ